MKIDLYAIMTLRKYLKETPAIVFLYNLFIDFSCALFRLLPLQRKIVFDNFGGRGLGDDPKYILKQMIKDGIKVRYIWLVNDFSIEVPREVAKVKYGSLQAYYHYATAKIWVDNVKFVPKPRKRKGQFYLQTWHAFFSIKKIEQDTESTLPYDYIKASKEDSSKTDLMYANNNFHLDLFKKAFWYDGNIIKSDIPHLSVLFNSPQYLKKQIYSKYNIPQNKKIILYAPTFRKSFDINVFKWNYSAIHKAFEKKYHNEFVFCLKFHPNIAEKASLISSDFIYNVSNYPDPAELVSVSDILITDLSSISFTMAIKGGPVFLFMKDFDEYKRNDRTQYFSANELPFQFAQTEDELVKNIEQFDDVLYKRKLCDFFEKIGLIESGKGAIIISNILKEKLI